jgi:hypothetical protein
VVGLSGVVLPNQVFTEHQQSRDPPEIDQVIVPGGGILHIVEGMGVDEVVTETVVGHATFQDTLLEHGKGFLPEAEKPFVACIGTSFRMRLFTAQKER